MYKALSRLGHYVEKLLTANKAQPQEPEQGLYLLVVATDSPEAIEAGMVYPAVAVEIQQSRKAASQVPRLVKMRAMSPNLESGHLLS